MTLIILIILLNYNTILSNSIIYQQINYNIYFLRLTNTKSDNDFMLLNHDVIRVICFFLCRK
jgi:hypothetical protein